MNHAPPPYSVLHHIGRGVATPKFEPRNCARYLQTTLIMGGGGWSENLCEVLQLRNYMNQWQQIWLEWDYYLLRNEVLNIYYMWYNHGHNILRLFDNLPNFLFITSETKRDY